MKNLFVLIVSVLLIGCGNKPAEIQGVVTYFFNDNLGNKPDSGAKILVTTKSTALIDSALAINKTKSDLLYNVKKIDSYERVIESAKKLIRHSSASEIKELKAKIGDYEQKIKGIQSYIDSIGFDDEKADEINEVALRSLANIEYDLDSTYKTTADGEGKYHIEVPSGEYTIIFVSNGRSRSWNLLEINGNVESRKFLVEPGQIKEESVNFDM